MRLCTLFIPPFWLMNLDPYPIKRDRNINTQKSIYPEYPPIPTPSISKSLSKILLFLGVEIHQSLKNLLVAGIRNRTDFLQPYESCLIPTIPPAFYKPQKARADSRVESAIAIEGGISALNLKRLCIEIAYNVRKLDGEPF